MPTRGVPAHLVGIGVCGTITYFAARAGGWWHIVTVLAGFGVLANTGGLMVALKESKPA